MFSILFQIVTSVGLIMVQPLSGHYLYEISPETQIFLTGKSNVNTFQCFATENLPNGSFVVSNDDSRTLTFNNAKILVKVKTLDCNNRLITNDLYKTLQAALYPNITLQIKSAILKKSANNEPSAYLATIAMTLANKTIDHRTLVTVENSGNGTLHIVGNHKIKLSDYNIKRPTAMLGLIIVDDDITIYFDIVVHVRPIDS